VLTGECLAFAHLCRPVRQAAFSPGKHGLSDTAGPGSAYIKDLSAKLGMWRCRVEASAVLIAADPAPARFALKRGEKTPR
jgi:hypothetical protein